MAYLSLNTNLQGYIVAALSVSFIILVIAFVSNIYILKSKKSTFILSALTLITVVEISALMVMICYSSQVYNFNLSPLAKFTNSIPYLTHIILAVVVFIYSIYIIKKSYFYSKNSINDFSIKEALDTLPTGIVFMSENNDLHLSNQIMHRLYKELFNKDLVSGNDLWKDISCLKNSDKCVINEVAPAFRLKDGTVWQFTKAFIHHNQNYYYEVKATNITNLYSLIENTRSVSDTLSNRQEKLRELSDIIEKSTEEQVAVDMKVNLHDNFGNLLTLTKQTLREIDAVDETKAVAEYWTKLTNMITDFSSTQKHQLSLAQIVLLGEKLGCKVIINGELPTDDENKTIILLCINESLKNAYRHAEADTLTVTIVETEETVNINIHNETKTTIDKFTEGGGLTGLRQKIENIGGQLNICIESGVTIEVTLNNAYKRREINV